MRSRPFQRQSYRLNGYDYTAPGAYFITICSYKKEQIFGRVYDEKMIMNEAGECISTKWQTLLERFPMVGLDEFVVMPNHVHGIIWIKSGDNPDICRGAINRAPTLGEIVRTFKAVTTYEIRKKKLEYGVWQRSYHDHIIRNQQELFAIRNYIRNNPMKWEKDEYAVG
jgi:REP element-mobilizing transposase RayT